MATVRIDQQQLEAMQRRLARLGDLAPVVIANAINDILGRAITVTSREIRRDVTLSKSVVDSKLSKRRATPSDNPSGAIYALKRGLLLTNYGARELARGGVSVKVKKGGGRKKLPGAFLVSPLRNSGATGVAIRENGKLKVLHGPSTSQVMGQELEDNTLQQLMSPIAQRLLSSEISKAIRGVGRYA